MDLLYKQDWEKVKKRLELLWSGEILDRCCVAVTAPIEKGKPYIDVVPDNGNELEAYYTDPEYILKRNEERFKKTYFAGEAIPTIFPYFGTGGHAKYLSSKVKYMKDTIWIPAVIEDYDNFDFSMKPDNPIFKNELKIIRYLAEEGKGKFFVSPPDNCGSYDALSQLRGDVKLMMDFIDNPEKVKAAGMKLVDILINTGNQIFDAIRENNDGGSVHGYYNTWSPGKHMQLQCDLSVMISSNTFEEFIVKELQKSADWLDHAVYHLDGIEQVRHLDKILSINKINMIQWVQVSGQPSIIECLNHVQRIQASGKGLVVDLNKSELDKFLDGVSPEGLMLIVKDAASKEEAEEVVDYVAKWSDKKRK